MNDSSRRFGEYRRDRVRPDFSTIRGEARQSNTNERGRSEHHRFNVQGSRHEDEENGRNGRDHHRREHTRNTQSTRQMGFKFVQELLQNKDVEDVVFTLSNNKKGFKELLGNKDITNDMTVLLVKLLSNICECKFPNTKIHLFQTVLSSGFIEILTKYITTLAIQGQKDKKFNNHFWKDPNDFWTNLIDISRNITDVIPATSCECMLKVLKAMKLSIPMIELYQSIHITHEIKTNITILHDSVQKTSSELERKSQLNEVSMEPDELEPPDNFRDINVYPSVLEVTYSESPYLRPNVIKGPYRNIEHYLDVQFRLLREDFVSPLRKGICKYIKNPKDKLEDIKIYNRIKFLQREMVNEQNCYRIQYDFSKKKKTFQYENSRRFMFGSLLCFTSDNFKTLLFGKIVQRDVKDLEIGHLIVGFDEEVIVPENVYDETYLMVESTVYFEPYHQVLNVLKKMGPDHFPMERYIIRVETETRPPGYLLKIDPVFYKIEDETFWPLNWVDKRFYGLNDAQQLAFKAALTDEFSIIQGPPGTGKTFLGLKIAHTLIKNRSAWYDKTPILVICYTNHALDQFLEGIVEVTDRILRVGSRSKNDNLNKFNIRAKRNVISNPTVSQKRHEVRSYIKEITTINETLKHIALNESVIGFGAFSEVIPNYHQTWFGRVNCSDILKWLFGSVDRRQRPLQNNRNVPQVTRNVENMVISSDTVNELLEEESIETDEREMFDDIFEDIQLDRTFRSLINIKDLSDKIKKLNEELYTLQQNNQFNNDLNSLLREERVFHELDEAKRDLQYLKRRLNEGAENTNREEPHFVDLQNPHLMHPMARWQLYWCLLDRYKLRLLRAKENLTKAFRKIYKVYNEMRDMEDTQFMKNSLVVGMTTTGAARLRASLQALKSPIVIVEEAAEVLEAHIISSLTSHCKHLILIGDHQQLKPNTANYKIETKYLLGISLFERMVLNNIQCHTLNIQHRMRPEISCLVRPSIYRVLEDHPSVMNRPLINGVENCLYFIDHQEPEQLCKDSSKKNVHEAKFLINFAKHLILNGYKPENITILAAYLGQMFEMQREKKQHQALLQDVRIAVLDNYQGEESDIVLLSLVRSNTESKIGFLKNENRVCVALSRAKNGFYMMGNMTLLFKNSDIWPKVKETLEKQNAIGPHLSLRCQVHRHRITQVKSGDDFMDIPEGGCNLMCEAQISCGHICSRLCHVQDRAHVLYMCKEKCNKVLCNTSEHICKKLCYEDCGPCIYPVERNLDCGHSVTIACHIDPAVYSCTVPVKSTLPCGHEANKPCHRDADNFRCPHPCDIRVEPCGHACTRQCHIKVDPDHLEYKCRKQCAKPCIDCSLPNGEKHPCSKLCFEECDECDIGIKKHRTNCPHVYTVSCKVNVDDIECEKPCTKMLPCGHTCRKACSEPCGGCKVTVQKVLPDCNHKVKLLCSQEPDRKYCQRKCPRLLVCGHACINKCCQPCTTLCMVNVECSLLSELCGHLIKNIHCHLKNTADPRTLFKYCTERCNTKLKCGHICSGTCGECFQGRIHQRCKEKCGVPLICNHECSIPCRQACKPCQQKCSYKCAYSKCNRKCGDPCNTCKEPCIRKCEHKKCNKICGDICDVPACDRPCKKLLECGHPCVGFCGDPCPTLCRTCDYDELTQIFLGNEDEKNAIYVMLEDCKHIFESGNLEQWLSMDAGEVKAKVCPKCKTNINTTKRYSEYVKICIEDISNIKKKSHGTHEENDKTRMSLLQEIELRIIKTKEPFNKGLEALHSALSKLKEKLHNYRIKNNQKHRQALNKIDLEGIRTKLQVIDFIMDVYGKKTFKHTLATEMSVNQISFLLDGLFRDETHITDQEVQDITLEINRLSRLVQFENIQNTDNFKYAKSKDEVAVEVRKLIEILESPKRYSNETDLALQADLTELDKLVASSITITEVEKRQIVSALQLNKGHWFKCPNGHYYVITECGGATQISKCNECGVAIGGQQHRLLPDQHHAPEMDNSLHPAWSEAANLANYQF